MWDVLPSLMTTSFVEMWAPAPLARPGGEGAIEKDLSNNGRLPKNEGSYGAVRRLAL